MPAHDYYEECLQLRESVAKLTAALSDVASSEPIPTPTEGWRFCRDVARASLQSDGGAKL